MYAIEAENLVKRYAEHLALNDVSVHVPAQKIYGLLGPNGAGKTTLIRIINRITAPDQGIVRWEGRPMKADDIQHIGYLPEERGLYKKMKVGEQATYLARLKGLSKSDAQKRLNYWFDKFDIGHWRDKKLEELSKGMQQKIQFIITILHEPKLLIFDEPFSGFDPVNAQLLKDEILQLKANGATILFSTHNMASVEEICDSISLIHTSKVVLQGNVEEIRQAHNQGIYRLRIRPTDSLKENPTYQILRSETRHDSMHLRIQKSVDMETGAFLRHLSEHMDIRAFEEELPTMNDIFIQTVQS